MFELAEIALQAGKNKTTPVYPGGEGGRRLDTVRLVVTPFKRIYFLRRAAYYIAVEANAPERERERERERGAFLLPSPLAQHVSAKELLRLELD